MSVVTRAEPHPPKEEEETGGIPAVSTWLVATEEAVRAYAKITGDGNPIHLRERGAIVHGGLLVGMLSAYLWRYFGDRTMVLRAEVNFARPVFVGEQVSFRCYPHNPGNWSDSAQILPVRIEIWARKMEGRTEGSCRGSGFITLRIPT